VTYELTDEFCVDEDGNIEEDRPRWVSERFPFHNLEADRAKSTMRYYALDPNEEHEGEWSELLTTPCMVTLTATEGKNKNKGKVFNNIASVSAMRKKDAEKLPELKNDTKLFLTDDPDMEVFMKLPKWLQDEIKEGLDYDGSDLETAVLNYKKDDEEEDGGKKKKKAAKKPPVEEEDEDDGDW
jgi:hypothetical protein